VTYEHGVPRRFPSRPVADTPVDALLGRAEELAKGWLLALLEQRELEEAPAILAGDVVRDGPRLCAAVVRALADDHDLERLEPGGALEWLAARAGELSGSSQAESRIRAVEALRGVIWAALREELVRPDADIIEALAERLALVTELVRSAVLRRFGASEAGLADEVPGGTGLRELAEVAPLSDAGAAAQLWRDALEDEVARSQRSGAKLSLLLAELSEDDRVSAAEPVHGAGEPFGRFAQAVRSALRGEDILACETETRAWIIARTTGRTGARALGSRIAAAVQEAQPWRGAALTVGIGIAVLGEDAHDAPGLIEAADEWTFAAVSAGEAVGGDGHGGGDDPAERGPRLVG
jgi:GGDEF domain-containing protein